MRRRFRANRKEIAALALIIAGLTAVVVYYASVRDPDAGQQADRVQLPPPNPLGRELSGSTEDGQRSWRHGEGPTGLSTLIEQLGHTDHHLYNEARLRLRCDHEAAGLRASVDAVRWIDGAWHAAQLDTAEPSRASFGLGSEPGPSGPAFETLVDRAVLEAAAAQRFYRQARRADWLRVALPRTEGRIVATFHLGEAFNTPAQRLLELCLNE